jgi:hypothetical protein
MRNAWLTHWIELYDMGYSVSAVSQAVAFVRASRAFLQVVALYSLKPVPVCRDHRTVRGKKKSPSCPA